MNSFGHLEVCNIKYTEYSTILLTPYYAFSFIKVGNSPKEAETHQGSWRQAILNSVVTPSKGLDNEAPAEYLSPMRKRKSSKI